MTRVDDVYGRLHRINFQELLNSRNVDSLDFDFKGNIKGCCQHCAKSFQEHAPRFIQVSHGVSSCDLFRLMGVNQFVNDKWNETRVMFLLLNPPERTTSARWVPLSEGGACVGRLNWYVPRKWMWIGDDSSLVRRGWAGRKSSLSYGRLFWTLITNLRLKNAYMTNVVKCGVKCEGVHRSDQYGGAKIECVDRFLRKEMMVFKPDVCVAFGNSAKRILNNRDLPAKVIRYIPTHPSQCWSKKRCEALVREVERVLKGSLV